MPVERAPLSQRNRFEVFKRDGHRCVYCGITALNAVLHVDHVVPVAGGGSDDPSNLVTSCRECNQGKSDVPLDERKLRATFASDAEREHAEQIRAYLAVQREIGDAKRQAEELVLERWEQLMGSWPDRLPAFLPRALADIGIDRVLAAVEAVARRPMRRNDTDQIRYFCGVVRNERQRMQPKAPPIDTSAVRWDEAVKWVRGYWSV